MTRTQKLALIISILASFVAFLDGSVVNVALPAIDKELGGGLTAQQWIVDAYLITLGALMLLAGSLSDLYGRKRIMLFGLIGFGITSLLCAVAPTAEFLIGARALQGIAGALLVPSSLALIISVFSGAAEGEAIGRWTAWTGISFIIGPLLGGFLVDTASWRWIFVLNILPVIACTYLLSILKISEPTKHVRIDSGGAVLCSIGLSGMVFALIEQPHFGWQHPIILVPLLLGVTMLAGFVWYERRIKHPMVKLSLFRIRNFSASNLATLSIYGALSIATFLITIYLQQQLHYTAFAAGMVLLQVTILMFFLSPVAGSLAGRFGPRLFMTLGPLVASSGFLWLSFLPDAPNLWMNILPGVLLFGVGLSLTVAPLTTAVLAAIPHSQGGIASAINNAVARIAGLIAIAFSGAIVGAQLDAKGFQRAMIATALLLVVGGITSWIGVRNNAQPSKATD